MEDKFEAFEEDFEEQTPNYAIWVFSYDANDNILGDHFVADFGDDPHKAVEYADALTAKPEELRKYAHKNAAYVQVEVETVVEVEDATENAGSIYNEFVKL